MHTHMDYLRIAELMRDVFLNQERYQMHKIVTEFPRGDAFFADFFTYLMFEDRGEQSPIFYSVHSPYDLVSKKETQVAHIFVDGKIVFNQDFLEYVSVRTGIMSGIVTRDMGIDLGKKNVLIVGSGSLAQCAARTLKTFHPGLTAIDYTNRKGKSDVFEHAAHEGGLEARYVSAPSFSEYEYIALYTNTPAPILTDPAQIADGAFVASHISSTNHGEIADALFADADIVLDWDHTKQFAKEVARGLADQHIAEENIHTVEELFRHGPIPTHKRFTIFRTTGTPMQNLAMLKYVYTPEEA